MDAGPGNDDVDGTFNQAGGSGDDVLRCEGACELDGGDGSDLLRGGAGETGMPSWFRGGAGADRLHGPLSTHLDGGPGPDLLDGGYVDYRSRTASVKVSLDGLANDGATGEGDNIVAAHTIIGGSGPDQLTAGRGWISLIGREGDDVLTGGPGGDFLDGSEGNDTLLAGGGRDYVHGGSGNDDLRLRDGEVDEGYCGGGRDRVSADASDSLYSDCVHVNRG